MRSNTDPGSGLCGMSWTTIFPAALAAVISSSAAMWTSGPLAPSSPVGSVKGTAPITSTGSDPSWPIVRPPAAARSRPGVSPAASVVGCQRSISYSSHSTSMPGTSPSWSPSQSSDASWASLPGDRRPKALNSVSRSRSSSAEANESASTSVGHGADGSRLGRRGRGAVRRGAVAVRRAACAHQQQQRHRERRRARRHRRLAVAVASGGVGAGMRTPEGERPQQTADRCARSTPGRGLSAG